MTEKTAYFTTADGCTLWMATSGEGPPVALCHGGPGIFDYLAPVAAMVDAICQVHRYDQRGSGRSCIDGPFSIERFIADLEEIREHLGHSSWMLGGHSWGANLAMHYLLAHPERVRAVVYISGTGLAWKRWKVAYHQDAESRLTEKQRARYQSLKQKAERSRTEEREYLVLNDLPNYWSRSQAFSLAETFIDQMTKCPVNYQVNQEIGRESELLDEQELVGRCRALDVPVLVVHGQGDPRPFDAMGSMIKALPNVTVEMIPEAGHMPWVEQPQMFRSALRRFLNSV